MPGPVASPNLTFTVTPPGGSPTNYTSKLAWSGTAQTPIITQNFGRQGDTATMPLVDDYGTGSPTVNIPALSVVKLVDNSISTTLFAGVCNNPQFSVTAPTRNEWSLQCTDFTFYADKSIVHGVFYGKTVDQIVIALTQQAGCGITADTVANGGFVSPGPQLASFVLNYTSLSGAWRKLAQLAGQAIPYGWYVDENLALHFFDVQSAQSSGVTFTTAPTGTGGSATQGHFMLDGSFGYEWDGTSLYNRILVQGATQTVSFGSTKNPPTDTWQGNGAQQSWPLRYTVSGSPALTVNGTKTPVDLVSAGSAPSSSKWQITQNSVGGWFLTSTTLTPAQGVVIRLWYDYQVPVVAQVNDFSSQAKYTGPNNGVFGEYINDTSLTTVPMALSRAQRERQEYSFPAERLTWTTDESWAGWVRAGEACQVVNQFIPDSTNSYLPGINDTFLVISNSINFGAGGYRQASLKGIRLFS
jgi:hypothetical protein